MKSRPTQQTLMVLITISSGERQDAATYFLDFTVRGEDDARENITVNVPQSSNRTCIGYRIRDDRTPENRETFSLVVSHTEGPEFRCDDGGITSHHPGYDCNQRLEVVINDNDGEPLLFCCVIVK